MVGGGFVGGIRELWRNFCWLFFFSAFLFSIGEGRAFDYLFLCWYGFLFLFCMVERWIDGMEGIGTRFV
jgi:hypothetical protein